MRAFVAYVDDEGAVCETVRDDFAICAGRALPRPLAEFVAAVDNRKAGTFLASIAAGRPVFDFPLEVRLAPANPNLHFAGARAGQLTLVVAAGNRHELTLLVEQLSASSQAEPCPLSALAAMREEAQHQNQHSAAFVDELADTNKQLLQLLLNSRQPLRGIFDSTFQLTWLLDSAGRVLTANNAAFNFSGSAAHQSGEPFWDSAWLGLSTESRRTLQNTIRQAAAGQFACCELPLAVADRPGVVEWSAKGIVDPTGGISLIVLEGRDLTALRGAEETVRNAERLAALGSVAAGIAHEINNPISAAWTAAEVAIASRRKPHGERLLDECLSTIVDSVKRCDQIVQNVLRLARHEPSEKSPHDVRDMVRHACETAKPRATSAGVEIHTQLDDTVQSVLVNALDIERALVNLIHNSIDASRAGDSVTVRTVNNPGTIQIVVQDQGCGIPQEQRQRIFDPFFTARREGSGTGLGLTLAHKIVQEHGGALGVQSEVNCGSRFTVELPALGCEPAENLGDKVASVRQ